MGKKRNLRGIDEYDKELPITDIQVLSPTKKGESGTKYLNKQLQDVLILQVLVKKKSNLAELFSVKATKLCK